MSGFNPARYIREVRQETARVSWPNRKETTMTTIMVFVMVFFFALFLFFVDQGIGWLISFIIGLGG